MPLLTLKSANGLKTSYGEIFDKFLVFFDQKYHFLGEIFVLLLTIKRANGLKTYYGKIDDKLLVFFDQKYHFLEILDTTTQKRDYFF